MAETNDAHLATNEVELAASNESVMHALQCERCAKLIIHYAATKAVTPLDQYPSSE